MNNNCEWKEAYQVEHLGFGLIRWPRWRMSIIHDEIFQWPKDALVSLPIVPYSAMDKWINGTARGPGSSMFTYILDHRSSKQQHQKQKQPTEIFNKRKCS